MRGIPKHCNTKQDYEYLINNYSEDVWKPIMQTLYNDSLQFFNRGVLTSEETGITDDTHKVVFPTHVGMNRRSFIETLISFGVPHTRGDEPLRQRNI